MTPAKKLTVSRVRSVRADSQDAERVVIREETCERMVAGVQFSLAHTSSRNVEKEEKKGNGRTFVLNLLSSFSAINLLSLFPFGAADPSLSPAPADPPGSSSATSRDVTNSGLSGSYGQMRGDFGARALLLQRTIPKKSAREFAQGDKAFNRLT